MKRKNIPSAAIAHIVFKSPNVERAMRFYLGIGLRKIWQSPKMGILELRGGTHILIFSSQAKSKKPPRANFDLMVDDVKKFRLLAKRKGAKVSKLAKDKFSGHERFELTDPDGRTVTVFSSHVEGRDV